MSVTAEISAALAALLVSGGLAACGSSGDSGSGSSTSGSSGSKSDGKPLKVGLIPPASGALAV